MLRYETAGPSAVLTIDDQERRNPITAAVVEGLLDGLARACVDDEIRAVIVTGAGDRAFSAGGDLAGGFFGSPLEGHADRGGLAEVFRSMRRCPKPVLARVNGHALAGGFGLAAACDMVIAVDTATFGTPEVKVGLWPMMISAVLQRLIPQRAAFELMMTGRRIDAAEAQRLGVVSQVVAPDTLDAAVEEAVAALVALSPAVVALGKRAFYAVEDMPFDAALDHLQLGLTSVAMTEDAPEGMQAFIEKRDPVWRGR